MSTRTSSINFCAPADSASGTYGGGLAIWETFDSSVTNNIFAYNSTNASAEQPITQGQGGGGIYANGNVGLCIANNTFAYNGTGSGPLDYADFQSVGYGGAVLIDLPPYWMEFGEYDEPTLIVNNIFYENFAEGGEAVTFNNEAQGMIWYCDAYNQKPRTQRFCFATMRASRQIDSTGCMYVDPQFSGPPYILPADSPLCGAGATDYFGIQWLLYQDIVGNPRPGPDGLTDMGAYESATPLREVVNVVPVETLIPADGVTQTMITAVVMDENGTPIPNAAVTWLASDGAILGQSTANSAGEASAFLTSSTDHVVATVWATSGSAVGQAYVTFASIYDPMIWITQPLDGSVSGFVEVDVAAINADGSPYPMSDVQLCVDGSPEGSITPDDAEPSGIETERLTNGQHTLRAWCLGPDGDAVWSQNVYVNVNNAISSLTSGCLEIFTDDASPNSISLSAQMTVPGTWLVEITDENNNVVYSDSGAGPGAVSATWDGTQNGSYVDGIYTVTISSLDSTGAQLASKALWATISAAEGGGALICGLTRDEDAWSVQATVEEMRAVKAACVAQYLQCTIVLDPLWVSPWVPTPIGYDANPDYPYAVDPVEGNLKRMGIGGWLSKGYHVFFYTTHGTFLAGDKDRAEPDGPRSAVTFYQTQVQNAKTNVFNSVRVNVQGEDYMYVVG